MTLCGIFCSHASSSYASVQLKLVKPHFAIVILGSRFASKKLEILE